MKIRNDFVTNSSSVSYIITINPDMAEFYKKRSRAFDGSAKKERVYNMLSRDLKSNGEKVERGGNELYIKQYDFEKRPDCKYDSSFGCPIEEVDFSKMKDEELWSYIYGEYFVNARLAAEFKGFGSIQVPRDKNKLAEKIHAMGCDNCERKDTENCHKFIHKISD